ncbi:hypothetical protein [Martelella soudanensis]|uniref:hypothetical protein n=1 Tax=unclassified Martelella TaxID=2629616 RepID=UPI0015DED991|nr:MULTISPECIES: hypothetical protein [unclassified Martelella]
MTKKPFTSADFRKELISIMPGYKWTVHKTNSDIRMEATGIQSSGFNRISTLQVIRRESDERVEYQATSAGYGTKARWRGCSRDKTLARSLRGLEQHYDRQSFEFHHLAARLNAGRRAPRDDR